MTIALLGRQPKIGLAELQSLYGPVQPIGQTAALIPQKNIDIKHLGGTIKIAKPLIELPTTDWHKISQHLVKELPKHLNYLPPGKVKLGLSVYDLALRPEQIFKTGLELKKVARANGRSLRLIPGKTLTLNGAQVLHNQLTSALGMELCFIKNGTKTWLAQTTAVQDIDDYARRDYGRPRRDAFVGMLPPKLAQQMLNLAQVKPGQKVLDPFCGTGVVLQEAALLGCAVYGSDINQKMVDYTRDNLDWLKQTYDIKFDVQLELADATNAKWPAPIDHVVCETYLGQPLSGLPKPEKLSEIIGTCNVICEKFLKNLRPQLAKGSRHCIAVPAWATKNGFKHLPLLDHLENLGYNRVKFEHASAAQLIYHREDQIVARELLVISVKE